LQHDNIQLVMVSDIFAGKNVFENHWTELLVWTKCCSIILWL